MNSTEDLEIEISFIVKDDLETKLTTLLGAKLIEQVNLIDSYYDIEDSCFLTTRDYWLRCREQDGCKKWQLKYRTDEAKNTDRTNSLKKYYEIEDEEKICQVVKTLCIENGIFEHNSFSTITSLIESLKLTCFAVIGTERLVYLYGNFEIDIDKADYGYKVGEIEYKNNDHSNNLSVEERVGQLNDLASRLGVASTQVVPGKMEIYLYKYRPSHFKLLFGEKNYFDESCF